MNHSLNPDTTLVILMFFDLSKNVESRLHPATIVTSPNPLHIRGRGLACWVGVLRVAPCTGDPTSFRWRNNIRMTILMLCIVNRWMIVYRVLFAIQSSNESFTQPDTTLVILMFFDLSKNVESRLHPATIVTSPNPLHIRGRGLACWVGVLRVAPCTGDPTSFRKRNNIRMTILVYCQLLDDRITGSICHALSNGIIHSTQTQQLSS